MTELISWSKLSSFRRECFQRYGTTRDFAIINNPYMFVTKYAAQDATVLDIGSGVDMPLKQQAGQRRYYSLEADSQASPDFRGIADVPDDLQIDFAWSNQVMEHITVPEAIEIVSGVAHRQITGDIFVATIPNIAHPTRFLDTTHITPWSPGDFYGLFRMHGYEVIEYVRYGKVGLPDNPIKRFIVKTVAESYRMDWMDSIAIVAQKS